MAQRLSTRLAALPHEALLKIAALGCALDEEVKGCAEALLAHHSPLPSWCVDMLLSPDLLPHFFASLTLEDASAAAVCTAWAATWAGLLVRRRHLDPRPRRSISLRISGGVLAGVAVMPDGAFCSPDHTGDSKPLQFCSASGEPLPDGGAWAALRQHSFQYPMLLRQEEDLYVGEEVEDSRLLRLRLSDGVVLASTMISRPHQLMHKDGRLYVITLDKVCVFNAHTLEMKFTFGNFEDFTTCTIFKNELYLGEYERAGELQVFSLEGQLRRVIRGDFQRPRTIVADDTHLYLADLDRKDDSEDDEEDDEEDEEDDEDEEECKRILLLEPDGSTFQQVPLARPLAGQLMFIGDELVVPLGATAGPRGPWPLEVYGRFGA